MLSVMRQIGRRMELMNSPQQAHVSLPHLQVASFEIETVAECVASDIQTFTCTVGKKPTSAASYLNDVSEVHELLEALNRIASRDHMFYSSNDLRLLNPPKNVQTSLSNFNEVNQSVETISSGISRSMSMNALSGGRQSKIQPLAPPSLSQFLGAMEEEDDDDAVFF